MGWEDGGNAFDLQYKFVCDDDIRLEGVADWSALIYNCDLPREGNAHVSQLVAQALLVCGFRQAGAGMGCTSIASPITRSVNDRARSISLAP